MAYGLRPVCLEPCCLSDTLAVGWDLKKNQKWVLSSYCYQPDCRCSFASRTCRTLYCRSSCPRPWPTAPRWSPPSRTTRAAASPVQDGNKSVIIFWVRETVQRCAKEWAFSHKKHGRISAAWKAAKCLEELMAPHLMCPHLMFFNLKIALSLAMHGISILEISYATGY